MAIIITIIISVSMNSVVIVMISIACPMNNALLEHGFKIDKKHTYTKTTEIYMYIDIDIDIYIYIHNCYINKSNIQT